MIAETKTARLLLIDDDPNLLEVLAEWFRTAGYEVRTATDGIEALQHLRARPTDIIVTDLKMPGLNGLQLLPVFKELAPTSEVIFLTGQGTMNDAIQALREGQAFDFLLKPLRNFSQLHVVVEKALARKEAIASSLPVAPGPMARPWPAHLEELTSRETEIMGLLKQGLDNRAIGDRVGLSEKTIKNYLSRIYEKLQVKSRTQAIAFCHEHGLL